MLGVLNVKTPVPLVSGEPLVEFAYQSRVAPAEAVPANETLPVLHRAAGVVLATVGNGPQLIVRELVALLHPAAPVTVKVAENEPLATDGVKL
jgi:hypothetical protein